MAGVPRNPVTPFKWAEQAERYGILGNSIEQYMSQISLRPASKADFKQYLCLRTIWKKQKNLHLRSYFAKELDIAKQFLVSEPFEPLWSAYLTAVADDTPVNLSNCAALGHFFSVRYQQLQVVRRISGNLAGSETRSEASIGSDPQGRGRARPAPGKYKEQSDDESNEDTQMTDIDNSPGTQHSSGLRLSPNSQQSQKSGHFPKSTKSPKSTDSRRTPELLEKAQKPHPKSSPLSQGGQSWHESSVGDSDRVTGASSGSGLDMDEKADEEIVNVALYLYLNSAAACCPTATAEWNATRQLFEFGPGTKKSFKARTDGILQSEHGAIRAIIEVKPYSRGFSEQDVQWQETCEMAAWIYERDEDETSFTLDDDGETYRR